MTTPQHTDLAHAVAMERERIAAWHERMAHQAREIASHVPPDSNRWQALTESFAVHITSARAIRNGAHNREQA